MILFIIFCIFPIIWFFILWTLFNKILNNNKSLFNIIFTLSLIFTFFSISIYYYYFTWNSMITSSVINNISDYGNDNIDNPNNIDLQGKNSKIENISDLNNLGIIKYYLKYSTSEEILKLIIGIFIYLIIMKIRKNNIDKIVIFISALILSDFSFQLIENFLYLINWWMTIPIIIFRYMNLIHYIMPIILVGIYISNKNITYKHIFIAFIFWALLHSLFNILATFNFYQIISFLFIIMIIIAITLYTELLDKIEFNKFDYK